MLQTHHALKILELSGYIEYTEEVDNNSRLLFTVTRDELYKYLSQDKRTDEIIQTILRSYTGLFADYIYIDEAIISTRSGYSRQEIYDVLIGLAKYRIIKYIPRKKTPLIIYTRSREEQKYLVITKAAYEERKSRFEYRLNQVVEYIEDDKICRSKRLLAYFGEKNLKDCRCCDVCLSKHDAGLTQGEFNTIQTDVLKSISEAPKLVKKITDELAYPAEKTIQVIRFLAEHDPRFDLENGLLSLKKEADQ